MPRGARGAPEEQSARQTSGGQQARAARIAAHGAALTPQGAVGAQVGQPAPAANVQLQVEAAAVTQPQGRAIARQRARGTQDEQPQAVADEGPRQAAACPGEVMLADDDAAGGTQEGLIRFTAQEADLLRICLTRAMGAGATRLRRQAGRRSEPGAAHLRSVLDKLDSVSALESAQEAARPWIDGADGGTGGTQ